MITIQELSSETFTEIIVTRSIIMKTFFLHNVYKLRNDALLIDTYQNVTLLHVRMDGLYKR